MPLCWGCCFSPTLSGNWSCFKNTSLSSLSPGGDASSTPAALRWEHATGEGRNEQRAKQQSFQQVKRLNASFRHPTVWNEVPGTSLYWCASYTRQWKLLRKSLCGVGAEQLVSPWQHHPLVTARCVAALLPVWPGNKLEDRSKQQENKTYIGERACEERRRLPQSFQKLQEMKWATPI